MKLDEAQKALLLSFVETVPGLQIAVRGKGGGGAAGTLANHILESGGNVAWYDAPENAEGEKNLSIRRDEPPPRSYEQFFLLHNDPDVATLQEAYRSLENVALLCILTEGKPDRWALEPRLEEAGFSAPALTELGEGITLVAAKKLYHWGG